MNIYIKYQDDFWYIISENKKYFHENGIWKDYLCKYSSKETAEEILFKYVDPSDNIIFRIGDVVILKNLEGFHPEFIVWYNNNKQLVIKGFVGNSYIIFERKNNYPLMFMNLMSIDKITHQ